MKIKKISVLSLLIITSLMISFTSCKKEGCTDPLANNYDEKAKKDDGTCTFDVAPIDVYVELTDHLKTNNMDLDEILALAYITADDLNTNGTSTYYIIDLRADTAYTRGHIPGAVNTTLGNIVTQAGSAGGKTIVVVCYTGQSAAHGLVALRLSGYPTAKSLKFGMSSWNGDFDSWTNNCNSLGSSNWVSENITSNVTFSESTFTSDLTTGAEILTERVSVMLNGGFSGISATDVLSSPTSYFINNYWDAASVTTYGNISGAYRINPLTLTNGEILNLDPSKTIVTYCWTGQTSSMITAYLTVLGYTAKSLKFGANGMIFSDLAAAKQWPGSGSYAY